MWPRRPSLGIVFVLAYFLLLAWPGLTMRFSPDDTQNLYGYWMKPWWALLRDLLLPGDAYRPAGALFYLPLFKVFGFEPLPYRMVALALLCINVVLLYRLAAKLSGSETAGALGALVGCFHAKAITAYLSNAVIYDVLCLGFLLGALLFYVSVRERRTLSWGDTAVLLLLYIAALGSKETAVVLPVLLGVYELSSPQRCWRNVMVCGAVAAAYSAVVIFGPTLTQVGVYKPIWTLRQFSQTSRTYLGMLWFLDDMLSARLMITFWAALLLLSAWLRRREMWFGAAFAFFTFLPLNFIGVREGYALYVPMAGFGIWASGLMTPVVGWRRTSALVLALSAVGLALAHYPRSRRGIGPVSHAQEETWQLVTEMKKLAFHPPPGSRLLFEDAPFSPFQDMYMLPKLVYRDRTLRVGLLDPGATAIRGDVHDHYDAVFLWTGQRMIRKGP